MASPCGDFELGYMEQENDPDFSSSGDTIISQIPLPTQNQNKKSPPPKPKPKSPQPPQPQFSDSGDSIISQIVVPEETENPPKQSRFKNLSDQERDELLSNVSSKSTKYATETGTRVFKG